MRGIAKLLFGDDAGAGRLLDLLGNPNESGMADRARRSGEWCGTTPGANPGVRQPADAVFGPRRPRKPGIRPR